tara:strand:+ start:15765 stop:16019 length:255 start_codon:yes stop_codon:yes gene_type:complete
MRELMIKKDVLQDWVVAALKDSGGSASIVQIAQHIWAHHESELRASGDLFFTWQYDMRWACSQLRTRNIVRAAAVSRRGEWSLV